MQSRFGFLAGNTMSGPNPGNQGGQRALLRMHGLCRGLTVFVPNRSVTIPALSTSDSDRQGLSRYDRGKRVTMKFSF